jgi:hypothetical protein
VRFELKDTAAFNSSLKLKKGTFYCVRLARAVIPETDLSAKRYDLNADTVVFLGGLVLFFTLFLFYPVSFLLKGAFVADNKLTLKW